MHAKQACLMTSQVNIYFRLRPLQSSPLENVIRKSHHVRIKIFFFCELSLINTWCCWADANIPLLRHEFIFHNLSSSVCYSVIIHGMEKLFLNYEIFTWKICEWKYMYISRDTFSFRLSRGILIGNIPTVKDINTQVAEQRNATMKKIKPMLSYMNFDNFMRNCKLFIWFRSMIVSASRYDQLPIRDFNFFVQLKKVYSTLNW